MLITCFSESCQIIKIYGDVLRVGTTSVTVRLIACRHSVYNGSQRDVCSIDMVFVRIDGDGEPVPIKNIMKEYEDRRVKKEEEIRKDMEY